MRLSIGPYYLREAEALDPLCNITVAFFYIGQLLGPLYSSAPSKLYSKKNSYACLKLSAYQAILLITLKD